MVKSLRFLAVAHHLHNDCFHDGNCDPEEFIAEIIHGVTDYISDAAGLAATQAF